MLGMGRQTDALTGKMGRLKVAALGAATAMAGLGILKGMGTLVKYGDKLVEQQSKLRQLGVSDQNIRTLTQTAFAASMRYPTVTYDQALETSIVTRETLGTSIRTAKALPATIKILASLENMPSLKSDATHALHEMLKSVDIFGRDTDNQGHLSVSRLDTGLREMLATVQQSQGLVTPALIYRVFRQIGAQGRMMDIRTFMPVIAEATAQMGVRGGRGIANVIKQMTGGTFGKSYGAALVKFGLLKHGFASINHPVHGGYESLKSADEVVGNKLFFADFPKWVAAVLVPALARHGYKNIKSQLGALNQLFSSKPSTAFLGSLISNPESYSRAAEQINKQMGVDTYKVQMKTSLAANIKAFNSAFTSLLETIGAPLVPTAIRILGQLTKAITGVTKWAAIHPVMVKRIVDGIAALGAALVVFGTAAVITALATMGGIPALIATAVVGVTTAIGLVIAQFNGFPHVFQSIGGAIKTLTGDFDHFLDIIRHPINSFFGDHQGATFDRGGPHPFRGGAVVPSPRASAPAQHVTAHITNPGEIGAAAGHALRHATAAPPSGPTGFNGRLTPTFAGVGAP